jgi:hypothetical protein
MQKYHALSAGKSSILIVALTKPLAGMHKN